jgi:hypothetical protein
MRVIETDKESRSESPIRHGHFTEDRGMTFGRMRLL